MSPQESLQELRQQIDAVDEEIITAIVRRVALARTIGAIKYQSAQPVLDPAREAAVVAHAAARGREAGIPDQELRALYWHIMALSRKTQLTVAASHAGSQTSNTAPV